jgi:hypothetical protein
VEDFPENLRGIPYVPIIPAGFSRIISVEPPIYQQYFLVNF